MNMIIIAALLITLAGIVIGLRNTEPKRLLVFLIFGIPALLIASAFILIGGAIGGGLSLLFNMGIGQILVSSLFGGLAAAAAFHGLFTMIFYKGMKGSKIPLSRYLGAPLSYTIGTMLGVNLAFALITEPHWRNIATVFLSGLLPVIFIMGLERLKLIELPRTKKAD